MNEIFPESFKNQCNVLNELEGLFKEHRPELLSGYFYTSNRLAFAVATDVVSGSAQNLLPGWLELVKSTFDLLLDITFSEETEIIHLSDIGVSVREIFSDIQDFDSV